MALPWSYRTSLAEEQRAVRERAGLADVSQLQVLSVTGPGAVDCLERLLPRRIADMPISTMRFSVVLSRFGRIVDEAMILRLRADAFWISHGCGTTRAQLHKLVEAGEVANVTIDALDDLHVLSLQGPRSLPVLAALAPPEAALEELPFLAHRRVTLGAASLLVTRSGFTGELGFELFCASNDVVALWRSLLQVGAPEGLVPYAYRCLDLLRIEAGFTLYPVDLAIASSLWEADLGWMVRDKTADYVGSAALMRAKAAPSTTRRFAGLRFGGEQAIARGTMVQRDARDIGVVTSSAYAPASAETLCLVHVDALELGRAEPVQVGHTEGTLQRLPFRERRGGTAPRQALRPELG